MTLKHVTGCVAALGLAMLLAAPAQAQTYAGKIWSRIHNCSVFGTLGGPISGRCDMGAGSEGFDTHSASFTNLMPTDGSYRIVYDNGSYLLARPGIKYMDVMFHSSQSNTNTSWLQLPQIGQQAAAR